MMSTRTVEEIVEAYLHRLDAALGTLPAGRRHQLVAEVRQHIADAGAAEANVDEATIRTILDHVGAPEEIAAAALGDSPLPTRRFGRRGQIALAICLVLVLVAVVVKLVVLPTSRPPTGKLPAVAQTAVQMPNVVGLPVEKASGLIRAQGVTVTVTFARPPSRAAAAGIVIAQTPPAGTFVHSPARVFLLISNGRPGISPGSTTTTIGP